MYRIIRTGHHLATSRFKNLLSIDIRLLILLAFIFNSMDYSFAVQCYKCAVALEKIYISNNTIVTPICSKFDESEDYIVDCPFSTMCLKTISTLHLQNGQIQDTVTRGCAQQKDTTQVFRNRQWQHEHSVQEVYEEGCEKDNLAASTKTRCYCRGDLCNSANRINALNLQTTQTIAVIIVLSLVR